MLSQSACFAYVGQYNWVKAQTGNCRVGCLQRTCLRANVGGVWLQSLGLQIGGRGLCLYLAELGERWIGVMGDIQVRVMRRLAVTNQIELQ